MARVLPLASAAAGASGRLYKIGPQLMPSVTSVLNVLDKAFLVKWAVRMSLDVVREELVQRQAQPTPHTPSIDASWIDGMLERASAAAENHRNAAADFGTRAHAAIDEIIKGGQPTVTDDIAAAVEGFRKWYQSSGLTLHLAGDVPVYSRRYKYAGAADCLGRTADGALVVVDFKTSNSIHSTYAMQLAAYANAVTEMWAAGELNLDSLLGGSTAASDAVADDATAAVDGLSIAAMMDPLAASAVDNDMLFAPTETSVLHHAAVDSAAAAAAPTTSSPLVRPSVGSGATSATSRGKASSTNGAAAVSAAAVRKISSPSKRKSVAQAMAEKPINFNPIVDDAFVLSLSAASTAAAPNNVAVRQPAVNAALAAAESGVASAAVNDRDRLSATTAASTSQLSGAEAAFVDFAEAAVSGVDGNMFNGGVSLSPRTPVGRREFSTSAASSVAAASLSSSALPYRDTSSLRVIALVVRLDKTTGHAEVKQVADLKASFDAFKAALLLWHATQTRMLEEAPASVVVP